MSVSDEVALAEGEQAADRIISGGHMIDYLEVARALKVGQRIAIREAGTDQGKPYNIASVTGSTSTPGCAPSTSRTEPPRCGASTRKTIRAS